MEVYWSMPPTEPKTPVAAERDVGAIEPSMALCRRVSLVLRPDVRAYAACSLCSIHRACSHVWRWSRCPSGSKEMGASDQSISSGCVLAGIPRERRFLRECALAASRAEGDPTCFDGGPSPSASVSLAMSACACPCACCPGAIGRRVATAARTAACTASCFSWLALTLSSAIAAATAAAAVSLASLSKFSFSRFSKTCSSTACLSTIAETSRSLSASTLRLSLATLASALELSASRARSKAALSASTRRWTPHGLRCRRHPRSRARLAAPLPLSCASRTCARPFGGSE
mmetsp:Transcript_2714/g.5647  ORF Transcript_2714/g.5647 Transcript_2714/m.5647 type:complete len:288 (-) Transcript_2714:453-1316(-)